MPKNNDFIPIQNIEKQKLVEEVRELVETPWWQEYQSQVNKSLLSPGARNKIISKSSSNYLSERGKEGYGSMLVYAEKNTIFRIEWSISGGKNFFEKDDFGSKEYFEYFTIWRIKGDLDEIKDEYWKLKDQKIRVVKLNSSGNFERDNGAENCVKNGLERTIREIELAMKEGKVIGNELSSYESPYLWLSSSNTYKHVSE